jgi:uncharacterized protein (UPF0276 family)
MLVENLSSYRTYNDSDMTEWEFLNEISEQADGYILFDINSIVVSAHNHNLNQSSIEMGLIVTE